MREATSGPKTHFRQLLKSSTSAHQEAGGCRLCVFMTHTTFDRRLTRTRRLHQCLHTSGLREAIVPVVAQKEESSLIGRGILRLLLFPQRREKQQRLRPQALGQVQPTVWVCILFVSVQRSVLSNEDLCAAPRALLQTRRGASPSKTRW
jgi:hypothetical protein